MDERELYPPARHPEDLRSGVSSSGSALQPGSEVEGPPLSVQEIQLRELSARLRQLETELDRFARGAAPRWVTQQFATDAGGDLAGQIFQCPASHRARISRIVLEAAGFTPAVPYSNAAAYVLLTRGRPQANTSQLGGLLGFAPATAGGPIFPGLFESLSCRSAYLLNPEEELWWRVETGPATTAVTVSALVELQPVSINRLGL